eukprot:3398704-Alexandrium_andersonii.AAC.1
MAASSSSSSSPPPPSSSSASSSSSGMATLPYHTLLSVLHCLGAFMHMLVCVRDAGGRALLCG